MVITPPYLFKGVDNLAKGPKTKNRKKVDVNELMAYREAYGKELGTIDYIKMVIGPGLIFAFFATIVLYTPIVSIVFGVLGLWYGYTFLMPNTIRKEYESESFAQRNKYINNMTQIMTDGNKTVAMAISTAKIRAEGEFRDDLARLEARIFGADIPTIQDAFDAIADKYEDDPIFSQYMEQVETSAIEGNANVDTLKDIKGYHNEMKAKQEEFEKLKAGHLSDMKTMMFTIIVFIAALTFSFGFDTYLNAFAHAWAGRIAGGIYLGISLFFLKQFSGFLFDDSVVSTTTVK